MADAKFAVSCGLAQLDANRSNGEGGIRTPLENTGKTGFSDQSGAKSGALAAREAPSDPDLAELIDAWPTLPEAIRAGILAMVRAISPHFAGEC